MVYPPNPNDGQIYKNEYGVYYIYKASTNTWRELRNYNNNPVVTYSTPGLMDTEHFTKLENTVIPPFEISFKINDKIYNNYTIGFFGTSPINIETSMGNHSFVVDNRIGYINFGIDIKAFYDYFSNLQKIKQISIQGDIGPKGETGNAGIDNLETGAQGVSGVDGKNAKFNGDLIKDPMKVRSLNREKAITSIYSYENTDGGTIINAIRSYIGNSDSCCLRVKINDIESPYMILAVPSIDRISAENCYGNDGCVNCNTLYYFNMDTIEEKIYNRYKQLLDDYISKTIQKAINWLRELSEVFISQKKILCEAIECCKIKNKNIDNRRYLESSILSAQYNNRILQVSLPDSISVEDDQSQSVSGTLIELDGEINYDEYHAVKVDLPPDNYIISVDNGKLTLKDKYLIIYNLRSSKIGDESLQFKTDLYISESDLIAYYQSHNLLYSHKEDSNPVKFWIPRIDTTGKITLKIETVNSLNERRSEYSDLAFLYGNELKADNFIKIINPFDGSIDPVSNIDTNGILINGPSDLESNYADGTKVFFYNYTNDTVCYIINKKTDDASKVDIHVEIIDNENQFGVISTIGNPDIAVSGMRHGGSEESNTVPDTPHYKDDLTYYEFKGTGGNIPVWVNFMNLPKVEKIPPVTNIPKSTIKIYELSTWLNRGSFVNSNSNTDYYDNAMVLTQCNLNCDVVVPYDFQVDSKNPLNLPGGYRQYEFLYPIHVPSFIEEIKDLKLYFDIDTDIDFRNIVMELLPPAYYTTTENGKIINKQVFIKNWTQHYSELTYSQDIIMCSNDVFWMNKFTDNYLTPHPSHSVTNKLIDADTPNDLEFYCTGNYSTNTRLPWYATRIKLKYLNKTSSTFYGGKKLNDPYYLDIKTEMKGKYKGYIEITGEADQSYDSFISTGDIDFDIRDYNYVRLDRFPDTNWLDYARYGYGARNLEYAYSLSEYVQQLPNSSRYIFDTSEGRFKILDGSNELNKYPYGGGTWWLSIKVVDYIGQYGQQAPFGYGLGIMNTPSNSPRVPNLNLNEWGLIIGTTIDSTSSPNSQTSSGIQGNSIDITFNTNNDVQGVILGNFDNNNDSSYTFTMDVDNYQNIDSFMIFTNRTSVRDGDILFPVEELELYDNNKLKYDSFIFSKNRSNCRMHYKLIEWYERGWRTGACCGVVIQHNNHKYIIMKRSLLDDMSCGGGETYNGCVGSYIIQHNIHPYFMFRTDDMETFYHKPTSGYTKFLEDSVLSGILISKIQNDDYISYKGDIEYIKNDIKLIIFQPIPPSDSIISTSYQNGVIL